MKKNKKGSALVITLCVLLLLVSMTAAVLPVSVSSYKNTVVNDETNKVNLMSESGLQQALTQIKKNNSLSSISLKSTDNKITCNVIFKDEYKYNATTLSYEPDPSYCTIESFATNGKYNKTMRVLLNKVTTTVVTPVTPPVTPPAAVSKVTTAIFGISNIEFMNGTINGDIGTNSTSNNSITYSWGRLNGTVHVPAGSNADSIVTGPYQNKPTIKTDGEIKSYPVPTMPAFPEASILGLKPDISLSGNKSFTIDSNGFYNNITVHSNNNITVDTSKGDVTLRIKNLNITQGSISINGNGKLKLYVDNCISIKGYLNKDRDPKLLELYCNNTDEIKFTGETNIYGSFYSDKADLTLAGSGNVRGDIITASSSIKITGGGGAGPRIIYAPNADISLEGGANVKSAVIGKTIYMNGGATITMPGLSPIEINLPGDTAAAEKKDDADSEITTTTITYSVNKWY